MAGQGVSVGKGFVTIYPYLTMKGFDRQLTKGIKAPIEKASSEAGKVGGKKAGEGIGEGVAPATEKAGNSFKDMALKVGKTFAALKLGQYAYDFVKGSVQAFGEFEQLEGGIDTLFQKSIDPTAYNEVMKNASEAYKTAGLSANQYMETTIGMSKKMLAGVGGDTVKAAKMTDMAIIDMADNVNKLGSDMEGVQRAYSGFAKGNFTMLDNLNLGYDGTRQGMQKLLEDAEKLSGKKYDINNLADITEAIHEIQNEVGITGTTIKEAEGTIQGSFNMMLASFENFKVALASGDFSAIAESFRTLSDNAILVLQNAIPVVINVIVGAFMALPQLIGSIVSGIPDLLIAVFSTIGEALGIDVSPLVNGIQLVADTVNNSLAPIGETMAPIIDGLIGMLQSGLEAVTDILAIAFDVINVAYQGIVALFTGDTAGLMDALSNLWDNIVNFFSGSFSDFLGFIGDAITSIGQTASDLASSAFDNIVATLESVGLVGLASYFDGLGTLISGGFEGIFTTVGGIFQVFSALFTGDWQSLKEGIGQIVTGLWETVKAVFSGGVGMITAIQTGLATVISGIWNGIKSGISAIVSGLISAVASAFRGLVAKVTTPLSNMKDSAINIMKKFKEKLHDIVERIKSVFDFEWSLPKPSLPHFSVSGGEAPWGFMGKGSLPSVSVDWYAKGGLFDAPSIIGVGEAGREAVLPIDKIKPYFHEAAEDIPQDNGSELIIAWLEENLGATINEYAPSSTPREFARMVKQAI